MSDISRQRRNHGGIEKSVAIVLGAVSNMAVSGQRHRDWIKGKCRQFHPSWLDYTFHFVEASQAD